MRILFTLLCLGGLGYGQMFPAAGGGGGTGTVTTISAPASIFSIANPTTTPVLSYATGQTANRVLATDNSGNVGSFALTTAMLPSIASTFLSDSSVLVRTNQANTYSTGIQDFTSATSALVPTQSAGDSTTKAASTSFVSTAISNAIAGVNPAVATQAATAAVLPNSPTYSNGVSGVGATLTAGSAAALVVDGYTPVLLDRILVKNQASSFQNGVYILSTLGTGVVPYVLTRALDFNQPSDINNTGAIPVLNGTANGTTSWVVSSKVTTVGTDAITFTQFSVNPSTLPRFGDDETPGGTQNGSNKVFTLANTPNPVGSLQIFLQGVLQYRGTDYTLAGATITYTTSAPAVADIQKAWYRY